VDATELCYTSATELGAMIQSLDLSPVELVDAVIARIERLNPTLNAFLTFTPTIARENAKAAETRALRFERRGPLDGIPYSIKDLEQTAGVRTTFGSKFFEENIPAADGAVAARMKATGGVFLGKTNTPHFGYKDMCDNLLGPPCRNPWNTERTSGASSGGAGAAVAAGLGPIAHGSDGAGSIRIPAALCGIFGMKPSYGRVPYYPNTDYFALRSHNGPMARTVRDGALMLQAMAGPDHRDPLTIDAPPDDYLAACDGDLSGLRVAWSADLGYAAVDPEIRAITERAAQRFSDLGATVEEPILDWPDPYEWHKIIYQVNVATRSHERALARPDWIEPTMMRMMLNAGRYSAIELNKAFLQRSVFYNAVRATFDTYDLMLTPQMPVAAWSCAPGADEGTFTIDGRLASSIFDRVPFMYPFNLTGYPAANVPCGFTNEGLPVGLQIVGRWHADSMVLRASACFEALQPWAQHRPPVDEQN